MARRETIDAAQEAYARAGDDVDAKRQAWIAHSDTREGWFGEAWRAVCAAVDVRDAAHRAYIRSFEQGSSELRPVPTVRELREAQGFY